MDRKQALKIVEKKLNEPRYLHTIGVMDTAIQLAKCYGINEKQAEIAAIFHDYAKFRPKEEMKTIILEQSMPKQLLEFHHELWHAPVGAYLVQKEVGINDEAVLNAIRFHTSGRVNMTLLEKIIYLADYIEPGRAFPGVEDVRELSQENLNQALAKAVKNTITFLIGKNQPIYPDTVYLYNELMNMKED